MFSCKVWATVHLFIFVVTMNEVSCRNFSNSINKIINPNKVGRDDLNTRSQSLARLLCHIIRKYFEGCDVATYHDEKYEAREPVVFRDVYKILPLVSFVKHSGNSANSNPLITDKCFNKMVFIDNICDIDKIIKKVIRNRILIITESTPWSVKDFLKSYAARAYVNLLVITHSMSQRAKKGSYLLYTHKLFTDGSGASSPVFLTSWINDSLTNREIELFPEKLRDGFMGHRIFISAAHKPPFVIRKTRNEEITWDGIEVRVVKLLGEILKFTPEIRDASSATKSPVDAVISDVRLENSVAAIGGIYKTLNIVTEFDTPISHMQDCASFIVLASTALPKYRAVMGPFQLSVWLLLCTVYIMAMIPLSINSHHGLKSLLTKPSNLNAMFWFVFSTFTNSFTVKNPLLSTGLGKNSTSILIAIYWVFTIIITSCYTGSIMAFITVPVYPTAMETADELVRNRYRIGTLDHDGWETRFNYTTMDDPLAAKLLKNLEYVPTVKEGIKNATQAFFWPYAFLGSRILLEYIVQAEFTPKFSTKRSLMHISNECFVNYGVTIVFPVQSIYTKPSSRLIIRALQSGLIQKIVRDVEWDVQRSATGKLLSVSSSNKAERIFVEERQLTLDDAQGMFLVLGAGTLIGFFVLFVECCVHRFSKRCTPIDSVENVDIYEEAVHERNLKAWMRSNPAEGGRHRYSTSSI